jgi:hypothetical protein
VVTVGDIKRGNLCKSRNEIFGVRNAPDGLFDAIRAMKIVNRLGLRRFICQQANFSVLRKARNIKPVEPAAPAYVRCGL